MFPYVVFHVSQISDDFGYSLLSLADCPAFLSCSAEIQALVDDLGLVLSDSSQGVALSRYGSKPRFCELYKRAKAKEAKEFQERFHYRFKKFARVDHGECQIDSVVLPGLFENVHISD